MFSYFFRNRFLIINLIAICSASCVNLHVLVQDFRKRQEPAVDKLKEPILDEITSALVSRYGLNFTRQDTSSLWFLCKQVINVFLSFSFCDQPNPGYCMSMELSLSCNFSLLQL